MPIRGGQRKDCMDQGPPPPPNGDGNWELQYCRWSGWTWVKKNSESKEVEAGCGRSNQIRSDGDQNSEKKKKGGGFWCFKGKNKSQQPEPTRSPPTNRSNKYKPPSPKNCESSEDFEECCCCSMEPMCRCCNQMCPCMMPPVCCCCCCCGGGGAQPPCKECRNRETQTVKEVKEQATKISTVCIPKKCKKICKCRCRRVCCPCRRNMCCPCVQNVCCCKNGQNGQNNQTQKQESQSNTDSLQDALVNYCLQNNFPKNKHTFRFKKSDQHYKSPNFSTFQKSLDILLRNNMNIMNLFDDKKELKIDFKSAFPSNHTVTTLSTDHLRRSDAEHSKLLTAVCDAILSSHKFDNNKWKPVACDTKDSGHSFSFNGSTTSTLVKGIISDFNFEKPNQNNTFGIPKEIGFESLAPKREVTLPRRSLTRLIRNKSRILKSRIPKKVEILKKNIDMIKLGHDLRSSKRSTLESRFKRAPETKFNFGENKSSLTEIFKSPNEPKEDSGGNKFKTAYDFSAPQTSKESKIDKLENLLNSFDYVNEPSCSKESNERRPDFISQMIDKPTFTQTDLLLNLSEGRLEPEAT